MSRELIVLPSLRAELAPEGGFVLTKKYLEGVGEMVRTWPGPVTSLVEMTRNKSAEFDLMEVGDTSHGAGIEERPRDLAALMRRIGKAAAVLGFPSQDQMQLSALCRAAGVPIVFVVEYSPATERQIMRAEVSNPLKRARRLVWLWRHEQMRRKAIRLAAGLQCSGTPTFDEYRAIQPNSMVFFDNRLRSEEVASPEFCAEKARKLTEGKPLKLIFGGRFVPMKGVMDLPEIATALKATGTPFFMDIYGDGPLRDALAARISELGLEGIVALKAPLDFRTGWVPVLRNEADLFVCCHVQGDPSSMYPEVMSCGVPIVSYDNVAFQGIMRHSGVGWSVPLGQPAALAARLAELDKDRAQLAASVRKGRDFALNHAFETTFRARTEHLAGVAGL